MMQPILGTYHPLAQWSESRRGRGLALAEGRWPDLEAWRTRARARVHELLSYDPPAPALDCRVEDRWERDGCVTELLSWAQPFGPRTEAFLIRPSGRADRLPGVVALHDHSGFYWFGKEKIARPRGEEPEPLRALKRDEYGGASWANECARRGYAVLVPDAFLWGSRRLDPTSVPAEYTAAVRAASPGSAEQIHAFNEFMSGHETDIAKTLFLSGATWTGVMAWEDRRALDCLAARPDVDPARLGCAGLSGGGLRTIYLSALDSRIRCAVCVGFMSTNREVLAEKVTRHTWMYHVPGLSEHLDLPDVLSLHAPLPLMLQCDSDDPLWTLEGQRQSDERLKQVYALMGAADRYQGRFYPGEHKFDLAMQKDALDWFDAWL
jgi:dienelactone hydrolase